MDALTLEQEALKLTPLARLQLAELLRASVEVEADREWNRKAVQEYEARYAAYERGEMRSVDAFEAIESIRSRLATR